MKRVEAILEHTIFLQALGKLKTLEDDRTFCKHDFNHLIAVARIAYIMVLEEGLAIPKDIIYAMALLHDIGKYQQYESGIPHNESSAILGSKILEECGFEENEIDEIAEAIFKHRKKSDPAKDIVRILYEADKKSRECFICPEKAGCNWPDEKKNKTIIL